MKIVMRLSDVTLQYPVPRRYKKTENVTVGVKNVSVDVYQGEVLGVIGRNGSGKSTLLKLMAGVFPPDSGQISALGSVSLLAGVGVGFHKDLTGRENAYLYGALMGRTTKEIDVLIDDIRTFAELDFHFDRPLRTYSSGMKSRLGISVATCFKPNILLIDEVLGVGDAGFKKKSQERVRDLIEQSGAVVIVSHSYTMLSEICDRILVLDSGRETYAGDPKEAIRVYKDLL